MRRMHQASQPQEGARPISASAGQLYGTDGNPVVLKVSHCLVFTACPASCSCATFFLRLMPCLQAENFLKGGAYPIQVQS